MKPTHSEIRQALYKSIDYALRYYPHTGVHLLASEISRRMHSHGMERLIGFLQAELAKREAREAVEDADCEPIQQMKRPSSPNFEGNPQMQSAPEFDDNPAACCSAPMDVKVEITRAPLYWQFEVPDDHDEEFQALALLDGLLKRLADTTTPEARRRLGRWFADRTGARRLVSERSQPTIMVSDDDGLTWLNARDLNA